MKHITTLFKQSYEIKKSTFHSFLVPFSRFQQTLYNLKGKYQKTNHIVWAYRYLNDYDQIEENGNDDSEQEEW